MTYSSVGASYVMKHRDIVPVVDVRPAAYYKESHIPNAISVPLDEIKQQAGGEKVAELIARRIHSVGINKDDEAIIYCQDGGYAAEASKLLAEQGYTNIKCLSGGYDEWDYDIQDSIERTKRSK